MEMERKRAISPSARTYDQLTKRLRVSNTQSAPPRKCLHCGSVTHDWVHCDKQCTHCGVGHPRRRCSRLGVAFYTPGGFSIVQNAEVDVDCFSSAVPQSGSSTASGDGTAPITFHPNNGVTRVAQGASNGVSAQMDPTRAAMIASAAPLPAKPTPVLGLERSGSNEMPLGPKRPLGTSWPRVLVVQGGRPNTPSPTAQQITPPTLGTSWPSKALPPGVNQITPPTSVAPAQSNQARDRAHEHEVWKTLQQQIYNAVDNTAAPGKPHNDSNFMARNRVKQRVNDACNILRQIVLGGDLRKPHRETRMRSSTPTLNYGGAKGLE